MNEITHIHLGREQFTIAVDAHHALRTYIGEIKKQVDSKDVVEEVELRMAELLAERGINTHKVVLMKDVAYLKEQLGEAADFADGPNIDQSELADSTAPKRLFRDIDNALLAGVCAGLGKYFGVDAVIVRLIFILLVIFGGGGFLLYVVLWLVVPEAKTKSDRLQMQGKSVTVGSIKQVVDRADLPGAAKRSRKAVGPIIETVARLLGKALGGAFLLIGVMMLIGLTTAGTYVFATQGSSIAGQTFFPIGMKESLLLVSGLATAGIVAFIFVLMGLAIMSRNWKTPGWASATIAGLFILAIAATISLGVSVEPTVQQRFEGLHHTQTATIGSFKNVVLHGDKTHFRFQPDSTYKLEYRYLGSSTGTITKSLANDTLTLDTAGFVPSACHFMCIYNGRQLEVIIHAPSLANITVSGEDATFNNLAAFNQTDVHLTADRLSRIDLRYVNPAYVLFASSPDQDRASLTITGMQSAAFESDEVSMSGDRLLVSHTSTFELKTDAHCTSDEAMVTLLNSPDKVIVNGQVLPNQGGLDNAQNTDRSLPFSCVQNF